jgi:DNA adenine methylase
MEVLALLKPIIKWAGGKTAWVEHIKKLITQDMLNTNTYIEPFCGGAASALALEPKQAILADLNEELINMYQIIKADPENLILQLEFFNKRHLESTEYFYEVRSWDRTPGFKNIDSVSRAARFIYLNKTCFNGLYRVNSKGYFNTPLGRSSSGKQVDIVQAARVRELSSYFNDTRNSINFVCGNYLDITANAKPGDIVLLDPPYTQTNHTSYQKEGFTWQDTERLKAECDRLNSLGCSLIIFNEGTSEIKDLFKPYEIQEISVKRTVSCKGENRSASEVLITNI